MWRGVKNSNENILTNLNVLKLRSVDDVVVLMEMGRREFWW